MKQKVFSILVLLLTTVMSVWAQGSAVTLADGTADAANWTITPGVNVAAGSQVTVNYGGSLKVNSLTAAETYIDNMLSNGSFDSGTDGWFGWGGDSQREWDQTGGTGGSGALKISVLTGYTNIYDITDASDFAALVAGKTYMLRFKVRSSGTGHVLSCVQQPTDPYPAVGYISKEVGTSWTTVETQFTVTADGNSYTRLCIQTGLDANVTYWIDDVVLGEVKHRAVTVTETETGRQWTMTMPKNNVSLQVDYKPSYKVSFVAGAYFKANEWALADANGTPITSGLVNPGEQVTVINNGHRTVNSITAVEKYIDNVLSNGSFNASTDGWFGWGATQSWDETGGTDGSGAVKIEVTNAGNIWDAVYAQDLSAALEAGKTYMLRFRVRSSGAGRVMCLVQHTAAPYPSVGNLTKEVGTSWTTIEMPMTVYADGNSYSRLCFQTGANANTTYWIDDVELGEMKERSVKLTEVKASKQWTFTMPANNIELQANCEYYYLALKDGTEDAANWSIGPTREGQTVTINYHGKKKVKSVKAVMKETPKLMASATAEDVGKVIDADGVLYANVAEAKAAGTTAVAMIAYVGSGTDHATYTHGLAIALADENSSDWSTAKSTCEGKSAVTNAAWMLPSQKQWKAMFSANGGSEASCEGLNKAISDAGGTALQNRSNYWTSTPHDGGNAWYVRLFDNHTTWEYIMVSQGFRVRACLAF